MFTEEQLMTFSYTVDFGEPEWLKIYYHGISIVSTIISFFSMYVILFQSGKMDGYRYYLFYMQFAGWMMDLHISTLMQFIPLFPVFGGYCTGVLTQFFGIDDSFQTTYTAFTICLVASALNSCFVRKHQAISKISSKYLLNDIPYIIVIFLLNFYPVVAATLLYLSMLSKENQVILVKEVYPNLVDNFAHLSNYVVFDSNIWAIIFFAFIFFGCTYTLILIVTTTYSMFKTLEDNRKHISSSNYAKHRATLRSLLAQFATCFLIVGPASIFSLLVVIRYEHSQVATHWIIVALTLHSSANAIVMIITYPPYRNFVMLWKPNRSFRFSKTQRSVDMNTRIHTERSFAVTMTSSRS
ncbi:hypothetical protein L3Y34_008216 [Caenorhabditis briggsae]|uniref:Serpentine Receptor, class I n=1 Tax=Caenorhabditis briggsae TaxID=6238 RepID=A0AAE9A228_CAEBR|nr:hypothetical protein L3Y34_008216 [Caenorhabditis briggsae]